MLLCFGRVSLYDEIGFNYMEHIYETVTIYVALSNDLESPIQYTHYFCRYKEKFRPYILRI